ncbi:hypothetical protein QAD02_009854 [Eretmocerus hayati]|uniref:Uncharacterized protein n=1 Tax=Eretmocerus hayati TaxID=131215 RepID=A0ACC2NBB0_9HYME|nr:hypothetical protein QAD02_009854 [Eretmocerus hayati]
MFPDRIMPKIRQKHHCSVPGCYNDSFTHSHLYFHKFPDPGPYSSARNLPPQHEYIIVDKRGYQHKVDRLTVWKTVLKIGDLTKDMRVCSMHFTEEDYEISDLNKRPQLMKIAIPSCNLPESYPDPLVEDNSWKMRGRTKKPINVEIRSFRKSYSTEPEPQILIDIPDDDEEEDPPIFDGTLNNDHQMGCEEGYEHEDIGRIEADRVDVIIHDHGYFKDCQHRYLSSACQIESFANEVEVIAQCDSDQSFADVNSDDIVVDSTGSNITDLEVQNAPLTISEECKKAKKLKSAYTQTDEKPFSFSYSYIERKAGMSYYTGLDNSKIFRLILKSLGPAAYHLQSQWHRVDKVSVENQLLITLIKLKRYTPSIELATMFDTHSTAIHNIFLTWVNFMAAEWKKLAIWPVQALINHRIVPGFRTTPSGMGDPLFCFTISQASAHSQASVDFQDNLKELKVSPSVAQDYSVESQRSYADKLAIAANKSFNILKFKLSSRHEIVGREIFFVCCMLCIFNNDIVIE